MIRVRVPATSANLGVGYDCLGMALTLYGTFTFDFSQKAARKNIRMRTIWCCRRSSLPCVHGGCRCRRG